MAEYGFEFKKQTVDAYIRGEEGFTCLSEKLKIAI